MEKNRNGTDWRLMHLARYTYLDILLLTGLLGCMALVFIFYRAQLPTALPCLLALSFALAESIYLAQRAKQLERWCWAAVSIALVAAGIAVCLL